ERGPGGDHLDRFMLRLAHDVDAAARHRAHKALALELRHGFAHRRSADAEILRQLALIEPDLIAAAIDIHRHNGVLQGGVSLLLEAFGGVDRREHRMRGRGLRPRRRVAADTDGSIGGGSDAATHDWYTICQSRRRRATT